jgi:hypothetical protein
MNISCTALVIASTLKIVGVLLALSGATANPNLTVDVIFSFPNKLYGMPKYWCGGPPAD